MDMKRPRLPADKWCCLSRTNDLLALMVDGIVAPQPKILRPLLGDEVCEREVAPKLSEVRSVTQSGTTCDVYPQLTPAFFNSLAQHLPQPCRQYALDDLHASEKYPRVNERVCDWLLCCWDPVLLPQCTRWMTRASIQIDMHHNLSQSYQTACLVHALSCMPVVTHLSLLCDKELWEGEPNYVNHPAPLLLPELTAVLPKLASLHIFCTPLYPESVHSLMARSQLQHLYLQDTPVSALGRHQFGLEVVTPLCFCSSRSPTPWQPSEQRAAEKVARQRNLQLRLALHGRWIAAVRDSCLTAVKFRNRVVEIVDECAEVRRQLQAKVCAAVSPSLSLVMFETQLTAYDGPAFAGFISRMCRLEAVKRRSMTFVLDNVRVHHTEVVKDAIRGQAIHHELEFLPVYSPHLNPIEYPFHNWKNEIKHIDQPTDRRSLQQQIEDTRTVVTDELITHVLEHVYQLYAHCIQDLPLEEFKPIGHRVARRQQEAALQRRVIVLGTEEKEEKE